ncbi:zinc finger protein 292b [Denticeps clupeoides]|uniref:zinc finger protein 292b n=1 Tax=Denticeps clupeoides TaxID=299321 RepID=UPI0010A55359|nr:zinc finger protein 292-like [Denticeps clupeoides]
MADDEAERDASGQRVRAAPLRELGDKLAALLADLRAAGDASAPAAARYCQAFCQTLVEYVSLWRIEENPFPLLEVYTVSLLSFARASSCLPAQCENVALVVNRLSLSCVELLLSLPENVPESLWEAFRLSVQTAHSLLQENGISQMYTLASLAKETTVWNDCTLQSILSDQTPETEKVNAFLTAEGPILLEMRIKHLIKEDRGNQAALLAKACSEFLEFDGKAHFRQMFLVCLCTSASQEALMEEIRKVDCQDALEMICNLESDGDEKAAFSLCSAFLSRQLLQGDSYCAWELTLFWSKLLKRLEPSEQLFLDRCRQMSRVAKTVFHLLFFIKVIQSEVDQVGLPVCIELCIKALQMCSDDGKTKTTICKTICCLLPSDLEVKQACQLTEFLIEPTVDSYYAVETLYNEPDQKLEEENLPIPNSLRCELLLVFKTQWPFDPEFWDWKALKRHCLGLMGEEASIVSSIDELNDDELEDKSAEGFGVFKDVSEYFSGTTNELMEMADEKQKKREIKKLREKGFVSARFRNWQAYMQYCVICDKEFLGHRIVRHAQTHFKDGLYSCPICAETFETKETLDPHVRSHVKSSCNERLAAMKTTKKRSSATATSVLKAKNGEKHDQFLRSADCVGESLNRTSDPALPSGAALKVELTEDYLCPVSYCRKVFKYLRNLISHVKDHGDNEEAKRFLEMRSKKVVCQYCRRHFVSVTHLNDHLQVHCGVKPYICIQLNCKARFLSNAELLSHRKSHISFKAKCMFPGCGKIFSEAHKLYDHEAQHYSTFTCNVPDCGKVLHSQAQLNQHQEEHVTGKSKPKATNCHNATENVPEQKPDDQSQSRKVSEESPSLIAPGAVNVKHTIKSMLHEFTPGLLRESNEPQMVEEQKPHPPALYSIGNTIQPLVDTHELGQVQSKIKKVTTDYDQMQCFPNSKPAGMPSASTHQRGTCDFQPTGVFQNHVEPKNYQNHVHSLHKEANNIVGHYNVPLSRPIQPQCQGVSANNLSPVMHNQNNMANLQGKVPAVSQALPAQMLSRPVNGQNAVNSLAQNAQSQPEGEKDRHHCAFESCTRNYSSYRSVTKHMKAAHPDFYVEWKLEKSKIRASKTMNRCLALNGGNKSQLPKQGVNSVPVPIQQMSNIIGQPQMFLPSCPSSNHTSLSSPSSSLAGQSLPSEMDNILNPIVVSQLGTSSHQSLSAHPHLEASWPLAPQEDQQSSCSAQSLTPSLQRMVNGSYPLQMTASTPRRSTEPCYQNNAHQSLQSQTLKSPPMPHQVNGSHRLIEPKSSEAYHCLKGQGFPLNGNPCAEPQVGAVSQVSPVQLPSMLLPTSLAKSSEPLLPSYLNSHNSSVPPHSMPTFSQPKQNNSLAEQIDEMHKNIRPKLVPHQTSNPQRGTNSDSLTCPNNGNNLADSKKKRSSRTKWPAIVKDGKFICCRCFREFQSPKSLGGHLSKRSHCKGFDDGDLTADLPTSFLDLLNSPQVLNASETPQPSYNVSLKEPSVQPHNRCSLDPRFFPNVTFPQANISSYTNEQNGEVFQQILDSSNIPGLFETPVKQETFPSRCASFPKNGHLHETSVIQHTKTVLVKPKSEPCVDEFQSCDDRMFDVNDLSDPLITQILSENHSPASTSSHHSDHINEMLRKETLLKMKEVKQKANIPNSTGLSNDCLLAAMASLTQNLMASPLQKFTSPDSVPSSVIKSPQVDAEKDTAENSVKKRLREQILAGDLHRRSQPPAINGNITTSSSSTQAMSLSLPLTPSRPSEGPEINNKVITAGSGSAPASGGVTSAQSYCKMPLLKPGNPASGSTDLQNEIVVSDDGMSEIAKAFERLDLDREVWLASQSLDANSVGPNSSDSMQNTVASANVSLPESSVPITKDKPFVCQKKDCQYSVMTKDALLKHFAKSHNYTDEMVAHVKKNMKCSPFICQVCNKTFTRNSNLRAHCQSAHKMTQEDIMKQKMAQQDVKRVNASAGDGPHPVQVITALNPGPHYPSPTLRPEQTKLVAAAGPLTELGNIKLGLASCAQPVQTPVVSSLQPDRNIPVGLQPPQAGALRSPGVTHSSLMPVPRPVHALDTRMPSNGSHAPVTNQHPLDFQAQGLKPMACPPVAQEPSYAAQHSTMASRADSKTTVIKPKVIKPKVKEKKLDEDDAFSPYRPYRCVHDGCVAAFTIQHNLILHYRAVHQLSLPTFEENNTGEETEEQDDKGDEQPKDEVFSVSEFRCQMKDCSRIFQEVTSLLQHYLQLHKLSLDKAGSFMSCINLGRFQCDQPGCSAFFTAFWKYIRHIDADHKEAKLAKVEPVEGMFRCDVDGCECVYTTRSNLLRHTMKKHHELYQLQLINSQKSFEKAKLPLSDVDGKENIENKKVAQKGGDKKKKDLQSNHWTKYGKPSLKPKEEASKMCTKKLHLQYPCMIMGCDAVMSSEKNIVRHYVKHGLSEKYLEGQRSQFIFCKKIPRYRFKHLSTRSDDSDQSEDSAVESSGNEEPYLKRNKSNLRSPAPRTETRKEPQLAEPRLTADESSEANPAPLAVIKRKRGRPPKNAPKPPKQQRPSGRLRLTRNLSVSYIENASDSNSSSAVQGTEDQQDQSGNSEKSFRPLGFEMSFLKFLEQSQRPHGGSGQEPLVSLPPSHKTHVFLKTATVLCKRSEAENYYRDLHSYVEFKNPQNLASMGNVRFTLDCRFAGVSDLVLKQLHEMRPTVVVEK